MVKKSTESVAYWATKKSCSKSCGRKGLTHSDVTKKRMSEVRSSIYSNADARKYLSDIKKQQYKNGFSPVLGKHWKKTPEQLLKKMGSKNPAWKGGITPINTKIRNSEEYTEWRKSVFERDEYTCQECEEKGGILHADHIKPFAYYPELRLDINNGRTLCLSCHRKTLTWGGRSKLLTISL